MSVLVGRKAPHFSVGAVVNGDEIIENFSLDQYIGKKHVIFFFYPKDFTFVCPTELHAFQNKLEEFKKTDPVCNYAITKSDDNTVLIDFLRGESEGDRMTIVEFNLYRYKQIKIGKNKKALIVYAFAERAYGAEITPFMKSLKDVRFDYIHKIFQIEIPDIELID